MKAELLERMGSDLTVSNTARVSFGKWRDEFSDGDAKLISYLADHEHTSPFRHCYATFRCQAPIFVARQLAKHQVGMSWNEISLRYIRASDVWSPEVWRRQADDKKQGSSNEPVTSLGDDQWGEPVRPGQIYADAVRAAIRAYDRLIKGGVCREQARAVLPVGVYTEWVWSGSLQAFAHMCKLRCSPDAQAETRELAEQIRTELTRLWPVAMAALGVAA